MWTDNYSIRRFLLCYISFVKLVCRILNILLYNRLLIPWASHSLCLLILFYYSEHRRQKNSQIMASIPFWNFSVPLGPTILSLHSIELTSQRLRVVQNVFFSVVFRAVKTFGTLELYFYSLPSHFNQGQTIHFEKLRLFRSLLREILLCQILSVLFVIFIA